MVGEWGRSKWGKKVHMDVHATFVSRMQPSDLINRCGNGMVCSNDEILSINTAPQTR